MRNTFASKHIVQTYNADASTNPDSYRDVKEHFRPSRFKTGLIDSANMIENRIENINRQRLTLGYKTLVERWLIECRFSHQRSLYLDSEVAPNPPQRFYTASRYASK
jgi:hypothetical protein